MKKELKFLPIIAIIFVLSTANIYAVLVNYYILSNSGITASVNLKVFSDAAGTIACASLDWGIIYPSSVNTKTVYIQNQGNVPQTLSFNVTNWVPPEASGYMSLTWDYNSTLLSVKENRKIVFTLTIFNNITNISSYSFSILIAGTG